MQDKLMSADHVIGTLSDGMTLAIGGWGSRRKPMALVRAILRSDLRDLTVISYGGPDVGLLCAAGKVREVVFGFVSLDSIALDPYFRAARQAGQVQVSEYDEGMVLAGLRAAAARMPFQPIRAGIGSDVPALNPHLRTVTSPYSDGEELIAMPALKPDVALVHLNRADRNGNAQYLGPDPYFDDVMCAAADRAYISSEQVVDTDELLRTGPVQTLLIDRMHADGVVHAPNGAHFTSCAPDYDRDERFQRHYAASATDGGWGQFREEFLSGDEDAYQAAVAAFQQRQEVTA